MRESFARDNDIEEAKVAGSSRDDYMSAAPGDGSVEEAKQSVTL